MAMHSSHQARIADAKRLLENTDLAISTISQQAGYGSSASFLTRFKRYASLTPREYREKCRMRDPAF